MWLAADAAARSPSRLRPADLQRLGDEAAALLLARILARRALTFPVAAAFLQSGLPSVVEALAGLDLLAGIPPPLSGECARG